MLKFRLFGFPVTIHWMFWLVVVLFLGPSNITSPEGTRMLLGWAAVVLVSILIHELGHAFTMRHFGDHYVSITLHGFGGFAQGNRHLTRAQDIYVSAAGPFFQIAAGVVMWWIKDLWTPDNLLIWRMMSQFVWVSIVWALLNLLPIVPLDGGRISLALFGPHRERPALILSLVCAAVVGVIALIYHQFYSLIIIALLAVSNFKRLKGQQDDPWMGTR